MVLRKIYLKIQINNIQIPNTIGLLFLMEQNDKKIYVSVGQLEYYLIIRLLNVRVCVVTL